MIHEMTHADALTMRRSFPDAMIIRRVGPGHYLAFDSPADAIGHPSAEVQPDPRPKVTVGRIDR